MPTPAAAVRPSAPTCGPMICAASGAVKPSMIPKIQTSAATLMTSGTVTNRPAMKLRRSHCIIGSGTPPATAAKMQHAQHDPIPGERREPGPPHEPQERPHDEPRRHERHHEADGDLDAALRRPADPARSPARRRTPRSSSASPGRTRTPRPPPDPGPAPARRRWWHPSATPPVSAPASGTCRSRAPDHRRLLGVEHHRHRAGNAPPPASRTPPTMNVVGDDERDCPVQHRCTKSLSSAPASSAGMKRHEHHQREAPRIRVRPAVRRRR